MNDYIKASVFRWARFMFYDLELTIAPRIRFYNYLKCEGYAHDFNLICLHLQTHHGTLVTLAHEFRHIWQYQILGDRNENGVMIHKGIAYKVNTKDDSYLDTPWEQDATIYETWFYETHKKLFTEKEDYTYQKKAYQSLVHHTLNRRAS